MLGQANCNQGPRRCRRSRGEDRRLRVNFGARRSALYSEIPKTPTRSGSPINRTRRPRGDPRENRRASRSGAQGLGFDRPAGHRRKISRQERVIAPDAERDLAPRQERRAPLLSRLLAEPRLDERLDPLTPARPRPRPVPRRSGKSGVESRERGAGVLLARQRQRPPIAIAAPDGAAGLKRPMRPDARAFNHTSVSWSIKILRILLLKIQNLVILIFVMNDTIDSQRLFARTDGRRLVGASSHKPHCCRRSHGGRGTPNNIPFPKGSLQPVEKARFGEGNLKEFQGKSKRFANNSKRFPRIFRGNQRNSKSRALSPPSTPRPPALARPAHGRPHRRRRRGAASRARGRGSRRSGRRERRWSRRCRSA